MALDFKFGAMNSHINLFSLIKNFVKSHSAKKSEKRTIWDFLTIVLLQNIEQIIGRILWGHWKIFEKVSQSLKGVS